MKYSEVIQKESLETLSHDNVLKVLRFDIYNCIQTHMINRPEKVTRSLSHDNLFSFSTGVSCLWPHRLMAITLKSFQVLSCISSLWPPTTKTKTFESFQNFSKFLELSSSMILWTLRVKIKYFLLLHVNN